MRRAFHVVEAALLTAVVCAVPTAIALSAYQCEARAATMSMRHKWSLLEGCMVAHKPGHWAPLKSYRAT